MNTIVGVSDWATGTMSTSAAGTINTAESRIDNLEEAVKKLTKTPEVRPDTVTKLEIVGGGIYVKNYKDGFFTSRRVLMPDIKDIVVHNKTVLVKFADNTQTVAVLDNEDEFNLEQGISICITKKLLGEHGSSIYNKLIKRAFKVKEQNEKAAEKAKKDAAEAEQRKARALARHKKKQAKKREDQIEIQKEAVVRALESVFEDSKIKKTKSFLSKLLDK